MDGLCVMDASEEQCKHRGTLPVGTMNLDDVVLFCEPLQTNTQMSRPMSWLLAEETRAHLVTPPTSTASRPRRIPRGISERDVQADAELLSSLAGA